MTRTVENRSTDQQKERRKPGRVPTSCAECRRLKLRCDRKVPCETCVKRGCGAICPSGSLTAGKGNRLVLANTEELHNKIEVMSARIRELEDALAVVHAEVSDHPHPLLSPTIADLHHSKDSASPGTQGQASSSSLSLVTVDENVADSVLDAFGTLTIGSRGETLFMGGSARSEYLLQPPPKKVFSTQPLPRLSKQIMDAWMPESELVPVDTSLRKAVMALRPPLSEAIRLCEIYLEWGKALWNPLSRSELFDEVLASVYRADSYETMSSPHYLCLIFSVFALAALFDFDRPPYSVEAQEFHILSHVAIHFTSPCNETTVHTVHALLHIVQYLDLSDLQMSDSSRSYVFVGLAVKLAYRIGIHLHSARWKLSETATQQRSAVFYQLFLIDTWLSFYAGRPPTVSPDFIDCPYPDDEFAVVGDQGQKEISWHMWSWKYTRLLHHVITTAFGARAPTYSAILELDRQIRDFPVPPHLQPRCEEDVPRSSMPEHIQRHYLLTFKEVTLLNIHRSYFAQALQDSPHDLLKHKYGPSVMAAYRSAWRIIESHAHSVKLLPQVMERMCVFWSHALSAAIVMCMMVTRAPTSSMAMPSLHELDVIYRLFETSAPTSKPAAVLLETVTKVWRKGHEASGFSTSTNSEDLSPAELDRVGGGKTRLISKSSPSSGSTSSPPDTSSSSTPSNPSEGDGALHQLWDGLDPSNDIHPRIMQDMRVFDGFETPSLAAANNVEYIGQEPFFQAMSDVHFNAHNIFGSGNEIYYGHPSRTNNFQSGSHPGPPPYVQEAPAIDAPVLDAAWQSFVEQLGF
ncbi:hypothetical protein BV22DRAFT_1062124 [Leucogyrophana mollusca]|uniref:Uncharacterized protein n=1 Tax=Leucogyrophana mollusca TaxID=85980 RepID=A0ACB8BPU3_9AGAM|nr:hypothetical protein BV22DRAFT_1062124 [Leucogyrophana mollusca]